MSTNQPLTVDHSTLAAKLIASFTGFGTACAMFIFSTLVLVPLTFQLTQQTHAPNWIAATLVFFELFGLTAIAGLYGVLAAARGFDSTASA
jgi:hypothetical protein